jgi:hypothetical protein
VTSKIPYIERKIDRTVVNVDALIGNAGNNALEILGKSPGVLVDQNGTIRLKGKSGVQVFIDDKPTYLTEEELANYLKSLPASTLKQVEIMTNPPAKYEAAGNAGVINIKTKRTKMRGLNGNMSLNYAQGRYAKSNNSLNLNYNTPQIGIFANMSMSVRNSFQDLNINRAYQNVDLTPMSYFGQNSYIHQTGNSQNLRLGLDYYVSEKTTFGIATKGLYNPNGATIGNHANVRDSIRNLRNTVVADNRTKGLFQNGTFNANLRHQFDSSGQSLTMDADYVLYDSRSTQLFKNYIYQSDATLTYQDQLNGDLPSEIKIFAFKSDYTKPIKNGANFSAGIKTSNTKTDNTAAYSTTIANVTTPNYDISNQFLYDETINAIYGNWSKSFKKIEIQMGLRVENTISKGKQLGNIEVMGSSFSRTYTSAFPTTFVSYKVDSLGKHQLTFSYGRRIDRPFYRDLNPFISPLDKFTFYGGNPFLNPTFSHNLTLSHTFNNVFTTSFNHSILLDGINETLEIQNGIYYSRPGNITNSTVTTLGLDASFPLKKWWNFNAYTEVGHLVYDSPLYTEKLDTRGTYWYLSATQNFTLPKGWSTELSGDFITDYVSAQVFALGNGKLNVGFQKKIMHQKGSVKLNVSDIFRTQQHNGIINNLRLTLADYNSIVDSQVASLTFSYQFGKAKGAKQKYNGAGSESEQKRVRG